VQGLVSVHLSLEELFKVPSNGLSNLVAQGYAYSIETASFSWGNLVVTSSLQVPVNPVTINITMFNQEASTLATKP